MARRKDGRPRTTALPLCEGHGLPLDDYPWFGQNGGRIPARYGSTGDRWRPRVGHCDEPLCYGRSAT